jgi:UDP-glucose-4-epimerase GalE
MSRFLVAGGAGYIGSHMARYLLDKGHEVTVFDNLSRGHHDAVGSARFVAGDLLDPAALASAMAGARFDAVMHFAALCYVGESVEKPQAYYRNNVAGSLNLLDAMVKADVRSVVFSSSCSTYGDPVELPIPETHPQNPLSPYGASKLMVERMLADYGVAYGLNSVSLRYFNAAGCHADGTLGERHDPETHLIPILLNEALRVSRGGDPAASPVVVNGDDYATVDGTCVRDYVHVADLASAHLAAAERMIDGRFAGALAFNLGTGRGFSVLEVIESVRRVTGVSIRHRVGPRRPGDASTLVANAVAARRELGWRPAYVDLDEIVRTAWRWFSSGPATAAARPAKDARR